MLSFWETHNYFTFLPYTCEILEDMSYISKISVENYLSVNQYLHQISSCQTYMSCLVRLTDI